MSVCFYWCSSTTHALASRGNIVTGVKDDHVSTALGDTVRSSPTADLIALTKERNTVQCQDYSVIAPESDNSLRIHSAKTRLGSHFFKETICAFRLSLC